ncbi:MAG: hypothetical protein HRT89_22975 [Lentisphaeria bacterium]|nr:hypothetical protein [Lentisphaeria bacterium]NQZ70925.1 hypothetical protein [Lentisphaeria bacterium]
MNSKTWNFNCYSVVIISALSVLLIPLAEDITIINFFGYEAYFSGLHIVKKDTLSNGQVLSFWQSNYHVMLMFSGLALVIIIDRIIFSIYSFIKCLFLKTETAISDVSEPAETGLRLFKFTGLDSSLNSVTGELEAMSELEVKKVLRENGLISTMIHPTIR